MPLQGEAQLVLWRGLLICDHTRIPKIMALGAWDQPVGVNLTQKAKTPCTLSLSQTPQLRPIRGGGAVASLSGRSEPDVPAGIVERTIDSKLACTP